MNKEERAQWTIQQIQDDIKFHQNEVDGLQMMLDAKVRYGDPDVFLETYFYLKEQKIVDRLKKKLEKEKNELGKLFGLR